MISSKFKRCSKKGTGYVLLKGKMTDDCNLKKETRGKVKS